MTKASPSQVTEPTASHEKSGARPCSRELGVAVARALSPRLVQGLGVDLRAAVDAHDARFVALHTTDGGPLPRDWAIPIVLGEVVAACAPLGVPFSGVAAIVVRGSMLPRPKLDDAARDRIACALADMLLAELRPLRR